MADLILEIVEGPGAGRQQRLGGQLEIGREQPAQLVLEDELVSRRHARVTPANGGVVVADLRSRNGTFVNGNEIHGPTHMTAGDHLLVGVTVLELRSEEQVARQPSGVRPVPPGLATPPRTPDYVPPDAVAAASRQSDLDALLDVRTKGKARLAPLAIFVLVVFVVLIFLATR